MAALKETPIMALPPQSLPPLDAARWLIQRHDDRAYFVAEGGCDLALAQQRPDDAHWFKLILVELRALDPASRPATRH
jgi:hypothetical protein